jgi:hypothetical protein
MLSFGSVGFTQEGCISIAIGWRFNTFQLHNGCRIDYGLDFVGDLRLFGGISAIVG